MKRFSVLVLLVCCAWISSAVAVERDPTKLQLASVSALVAPLGSEEPEYAKRADWVTPIASITKLMTALVVLDSGAPMDEWLPVVERHFTPAANAYSRIRPGSQARRRDLIHMALMSSENYAAYLLARHHPQGYDAFIEAMNAKADELGMASSHFADSSGLSDANVSTARDLLKLVNAAYRHPFIRKVSTTAGQWMTFREPRYGLQYGNTNPLVRSSRWDVLLSKTGYLDAAGRCLVMVVNMADEPKVVVLLDSLGTRTPLGDAGRIRRWLKTGRGGSIAQAALDYEKTRAAAKQLQASSQQQTDVVPTAAEQPSLSLRQAPNP